MVFDIVNDLLRHEIPDRHVSPTEQSDLSGGNVVLDQLLDDPDIVSPLLQGSKSLVNVGAGALRDRISKYGLWQKRRLAHLDNESSEFA